MREGKAYWEGQTSVWSVAMVASGDVQCSTCPNLHVHLDGAQPRVTASGVKRKRRCVKGYKTIEMLLNTA